MDPLDVAGRDQAGVRADRLTHRDEVRVAGEVHVDALDGVPELREAWIEIEIDANRDVGDEPLVLQHPGDVEQQVEPRGGQRLVTDAGRDSGCPAPDECNAVVETECADDLVGIRRVELAVDRLDQPDVVTETAKPEHVLGDGPGRARLPGIPTDHATDQDPEAHGDAPTSASSTPSTRSESNTSSARRRAARQWRS